jgi:predicted enzyme related to lactoylglutathione lyase
MSPAAANRVVHLELHTGELAEACAFYQRLLGWQPQRVSAGDSSYLALDLGAGGLGGGLVQCPTARSLWLPYVEVRDVGRATEAARSLGASVLLEPREGPAGWRSVLATRAGGELALWQSKR